MCTSTQVQIKSLANKQKRKQKVTRPLLLLNYIQLRFQTQPNTPRHTHPHFLKLHLPRAAAVSKSVLFVNTIKNPTATHHHPRGKWLPALKHSTVIAINGNGSPMAEPCALCSKLTP